MLVSNYKSIENTSNITVIGGFGGFKKSKQKVVAQKSSMNLIRKVEDRKVVIHYPSNCFTKAGNMRKDISKYPMPYLSIGEAWKQWREKGIETSVL